MKLNPISRRSFGRVNDSKFPAASPVGWSQSRKETARLQRWCIAFAAIFLLGTASAAHASGAVAKVAAGGGGTFLIKTDGTLWALGDNNFGQLGIGSTDNRSTPAPVVGGSNVTSVSAGDLDTVFLKADGTIWGAGSNLFNQLGDHTAVGSTIGTPIQLNGGSGVYAAAVTSTFSIYLKTDGSFWTQGGRRQPSTPVQLNIGADFSTVTASSDHIIFFKKDGSLWAGGDYSSGQLGLGAQILSPGEVQVAGGTAAPSIAAGGHHTLIIKTDSSLWAAGENTAGQLGDGTTTDRVTPVQVNGGVDVVAVAAGFSHTVFLKKDGSLWAVGDNSSGQLGDGTNTNRSTPVQVNEGTHVVAVAAGARHTVFLKADGTLWGVGTNSYGQLSSNNPLSINTPALINTSILLTPIGDKSTDTESTLSFKVTATDSENGSLTFSASHLPSGATFDPATQTFSWKPTAVDVGHYSVTFSATDGRVSASETSVITVAEVRAPSTPTGLSGNIVSPTAVSLTWTAPTGTVAAASYRIYRNGTEVGTSVSSSFSESGLQAGTTYVYTVDAVSSQGYASARSAPASLTTPLAGAQTRNVSDGITLTAALAEAVANPAATFTINLAGGTYALGSTPLPDLSIAGTTVQGPMTEPYAIIDGAGLSGGIVFNVTASNVTISGLSFKNVATHAVTIQPHADSGLISVCTFYGAGSTAAILGRGCSGWMVILTDIYDIAGTTATAEPAIYFHEGATDLAFANNLISDCDRGIGFGAGANEANGRVSMFNNMIADTRTVSQAGPGISVASITSVGAYIDNNTVYQAGTYANAIEYNNNSATITLRNNLTNKAIKGTNSPSVVTATNNTTAVAGWFKDPSDCDLRLNSAIRGVVDAGTTINGLTIDIEGDARPQGTAIDIGADEFVQSASPGGGSSTPPPPSTPSSSGSGGGGGGGAPAGWFFFALAALAVSRKALSRYGSRSA